MVGNLLALDEYGPKILLTDMNSKYVPQWMDEYKIWRFCFPSGCGNLPALDGYGRKNYRDGWIINKLVSNM